MKNLKVIIFTLISLCLGVISSLPNNSISSLRGIGLLLAESIGFILAGFIFGVIITLIIYAFDRNIKKKYLEISTLFMMVSLILATLSDFIIQPKRDSQTQIDKILTRNADEVNKLCPLMVDKETRVNNAMALPGNILQFNYTLINRTWESVDLMDFQNRIEPIMLNFVKTNRDLKYYRDLKTTLQYSYSDKNGVFLCKLVFKHEKYSQNLNKNE